MRNRRNHALRRGAGARGAAAGHGRPARAPRSGRRRLLDRRARSASGTAGCRSSTWPRRRSRWPPRTSGCTCCFNGEILNYRQLRSELCYPFRTDGDTETLLAAHAERGPGRRARAAGASSPTPCTTGDSGDLLLVRDRLGILPLYYYIDGRLIAFASEIKALLPALPERTAGRHREPRRLPGAAFGAGARTRCSPGSTSCRPGTGCGSARPGISVVDRYWSIPPEAERRDGPGQRAVDAVGEALEQAVSAAMVADVPLGAYLSGGVDSSLIVAMMSKLRNGADMQTFAAGFGDPRFDELAHARRVSELLGTRHHEVLVSPNGLHRPVDEAVLAPRRAGLRAVRHRGVPAGRAGPPARHRGAVRGGQRRAVRRLPEVPGGAEARAGRSDPGRRCGFRSSTPSSAGCRRRRPGPGSPCAP